MDPVYLKLLLTHLPKALPEGDSAAYPFNSFAPNPDLLDEGLPAAISSSFKKIFGWGAEQPVLRHRGQNVTAAAEVLGQYSKNPACQEDIGLIQAWTEKLTKMAIATFEVHGESVCLIMLIITDHYSHRLFYRFQMRAESLTQQPVLHHRMRKRQKALSARYKIKDSVIEKIK
jgi:hypothetical protein